MLRDLIETPAVTETVQLDGVVGVMAVHGGLEAGTAEAARSVAAGAHASLYTVVQPSDLRWHVPSIAFDPRDSEALASFLEHIRLAVSFHGFGRPGFEGAVLVGGGNRRVAGEIADAIRRRTDLRVLDDLDDMPVRLRGVHPANPVNLPELGGVQLELSVEARRPSAIAPIIEAVAAVLRAEQRTLCAAPPARPESLGTA